MPAAGHKVSQKAVQLHEQLSLGLVKIQGLGAALASPRVTNATPRGSARGDRTSRSTRREPSADLLPTPAATPRTIAERVSRARKATLKARLGRLNGRTGGAAASAASWTEGARSLADGPAQTEGGGNKAIAGHDKKGAPGAEAMRRKPWRTRSRSNSKASGSAFTIELKDPPPPPPPGPPPAAMAPGLVSSSSEDSQEAAEFSAAEETFAALQGEEAAAAGGAKDATRKERFVVTLPPAMPPAP